MFYYYLFLIMCAVSLNDKGSGVKAENPVVSEEKSCKEGSNDRCEDFL